MKIFYKKIEVKKYLSEIKNDKKTIGFVPTMGALHQGHLSLIEKAIEKNDIAVVSIFVNPTQFDNKEDLKKYPKTLDADIKLLQSINCDVLYAPSVNDVYDGNVAVTNFNFDGLEHQMEGKFRDGHFNGVGTIVKALFEIITPNNAYFGKKDFQQLQIIKKLVEKNKLPVKIKGCPIFREKDGLAMSSRNTRLTDEYRKEAPFIYKILKKAKKRFKEHTPQEVTKWVEKKFSENEMLVLEYFTIANESTLETAERKQKGEKYRGFIAVYAGEIRLIDNLRL